MRAQLESPNKSGRTPFRPNAERENDAGASDVAEGDVLMEDIFMEEANSAAQGPSLADLGINTSEDLIRRLKAREDVDENGVTKIAVAKAAYDDSVLPVPKKLFLLADWLLTVLIKSTKDAESKMERKGVKFGIASSVDAEALCIVDLRYWHLLHRCADRMEENDRLQLANRHSLPHILLGFHLSYKHHYIFETGKRWMGNVTELLVYFHKKRATQKVTDMDTLNRSLAVCLSAMMSDEEDLYQIGSSYQLRNFSRLLGLTVNLWVGEVRSGSNAEKARKFFLSELLPLYALVVQSVDGAFSLELDNVIKSKLQSISRKILQTQSGTQQRGRELLDAVKEAGPVAYGLLSLFLSQMCTQEQQARRTSASPANETATAVSTLADNDLIWRQEMHTSFLLPAFEMLCSDKRPSNTQILDRNSPIRHLEHLLKMCEVHSLCYYVEDDDSWTKSLRMIANYNTSILRSKRQSFYESVPPHSMALVCSILRLDERTLDDEMRSECVACAITSRAPTSAAGDSSKKDLLTMLFGSATKQRKVPEIIKLCLDAYGTLTVIDDNDGHRADEIIFTSTFSDANFCRKTIDVAVADFLYPEQVVGLLDMLVKRLEEHCLIGPFSQKRLRGSKGAAKHSTDSKIVLAVVEAQLTSQVLRHVAISEPVQEAVQETLKALQSRVIVPCLQQYLDLSSTRLSSVLAASILTVFESVQILCRSHARDDVKGGNMQWIALAATLDQSTVESLHDRLVATLLNEQRSSALLRAQAFQSIMQVTKRCLLRGKESPFADLMASVEHFKTLTQIGIASCLPHGSFLQQEKKNTRWLELRDRRQEVWTTWTRVGTEYLPIFERLASNELLQRMASVATELVLSEVSDGAQLGQMQSAVFFNANNLELRRWRDVLCGCFNELLLKSFDETWTVASRDELVSVICRFPVEWFTSQFLQLTWPALVSSMCSSQSDQRFLASTIFLDGCINLRGSEIDLPTETVGRDGVAIVACERAASCETNVQVLRLFTSLISSRRHMLPPAAYVRYLCDIFVAIQKDPANLYQDLQAMENDDALWSDDYHIKCRTYSLITDASSIVVGQLADLVGQADDPSIETLRCEVRGLLEARLTLLEEQVALISRQISTLETRNAYDALASLLRLQQSALLFFNKEKRSAEGYDSLLAGSLALYDTACGCIREEKMLGKALSSIASGILQAGKARHTLQRLIDHPAVANKSGLGCEIFAKLPDEAILGSCLGLLSVMCCTWADMRDGRDTIRMRAGEAVIPALAEASRTASLKEYEGTLELLLSASCQLREPELEKDLELREEELKENGCIFTQPEDVEREGKIRAGSFACALLPTFAILFCNSPENTLAVSQRAFRRLTACMTVWVKDELANQSAATGGVSSTNECVLELVHSVLAFRPILFRSSDVSWFLATASSVISSSTHSNMRQDKSLEARPSLSPAIALILTNLFEIIRLRRDFLALYLPHLTLLLKQLLPLFYSPTNCIYNGEARLFSRLLSAITSKSGSMATSGLPAGKLKSLAKPFSTHAAHVLVAYVRARTSPSELRSSEKRKRTSKTVKADQEGARARKVEEQEEKEELKRSMYNLCDIMGPHQKNVMMDMLQDEGEKIVMRSLWRSWESQRYRGA